MCVVSLEHIRELEREGNALALEKLAVVEEIEKHVSQGTHAHV